MDDRYEIRGKIGQGGIGAVYRAYDQRMNREVAIKRIIQDGDSEQESEATKQLTKEAGALASLQHPHIVTVYDVGVDDDGPYVVMEMLTGKTLDELVEQGAPLTFDDFRELALQTQEALIAAQDLHIVHRDLKPGNMMLTWLPSGKFQVKIVDFGLAKFTPKPSLQTLDQAEAVYGSIFFMAPEQFERAPIDFRTDMYAIGSVYYFALTGKYPFDGETGPQVMAAHLGHLVQPIGELRRDLPKWLCDWVMWHINRLPGDRPSDARESMQVFLQNDKANTGPVPVIPPRPAGPQPQRPKVYTPGAVVETPSTPPTKPQPLQPPQGSRPSVHTTSQVLVAPAGGNPADQPAPVVYAPSPTRAGGGAVTGPTATRQGPAVTYRKPPMTNRAKMTWAAIIAVAGIAGAGIYLTEAAKRNQQQVIRKIIADAADPSLPRLPVTGSQFRSLLNGLKNPAPDIDPQAIYRVLRIADATDSANLDLELAQFAISPQLKPDVRAGLFREVIRRREKREGASLIAEFARTTTDNESAEAALRSILTAAGDAEFPTLIDIILTSKSPAVRTAAKATAEDVIRRSNDPASLGIKVESAIQEARDEVRAELISLKLSVPKT